ncbi:MAG: carboxypeptidase-like regulatory domain-containing protein [Ferruginibacter sp.]
MQKKIILSIPEPCHENWEEMNPTEQGRFCFSCQKQVIDFTQMTDSEVYHYFAKKKDDHVCGRMMPDQLNTAIAKPASIKKKKLWYVHYLTTLLLFINKSETKAQTKTPITVSPIDKSPLLVGKMIAMPQVSTSKVISGKVAGKNGESIPFASITIEGTNHTIAADANGVFTIKINNNDKLLITAISYFSKEITAPVPSSLNVILEKSDNVKGEIRMVVAGGITMTKKKDTGTVINLFLEKVSGQVIDVKGNPVSYASVKIKNSHAGVNTDAFGNFLISDKAITDATILEVTAVGFQEKTLSVGGLKGFPKIILFNSKVKLAEVVVQSYSVHRVGMLTGTIYNSRRTPIIRKVIDTISGKNIIKTYPNPVASSALINIDMKAVAKGEYSMQMINASGTVVQQDRITVPDSKFIYQMQLKNVAAGIYFLNIINPDSRIIYKQKIIIL